MGLLLAQCDRCGKVIYVPEEEYYITEYETLCESCFNEESDIETIKQVQSIVDVNTMLLTKVLPEILKVKKEVEL